MVIRKSDVLCNWKQPQGAAGGSWGKIALDRFRVMGISDNPCEPSNKDRKLLQGLRGVRPSIKQKRFWV
jgi:hypothetical protein